MGSGLRFCQPKGLDFEASALPPVMVVPFRGLAMGEPQHPALGGPYNRGAKPAQLLQAESNRLASVDDRFLDIGRKECEAKKLTQASPIDALAIGEIINADNVAALDGLPPTVRACKRIEQGFVETLRHAGPVVLAPALDAFCTATPLQPAGHDNLNPMLCPRHS